MQIKDQIATSEQSDLDAEIMTFGYEPVLPLPLLETVQVHLNAWSTL